VIEFWFKKYWRWMGVSLVDGWIIGGINGVDYRWW